VVQVIADSLSLCVFVG